MKLARNTVTKQFFAHGNSMHCFTHQVCCYSSNMACSMNAEELSSNSDFDSFLSQLIDKDFDNILSDNQLPVSTLAMPIDRSNET